MVIIAVMEGSCWVGWGGERKLCRPFTESQRKLLIFRLNFAKILWWWCEVQI